MKLRMLWMFLLACLMAVALILANPAHAEECEGDPNDPDDECFAIYWPGMCSYLEPYSYWWYFHGCNEQMESMTSETVEVEPITADYLRVTIYRTYTDRPDEVLERFVPIRRQR